MKNALLAYYYLLALYLYMYNVFWPTPTTGLVYRVCIIMYRIFSNLVQALSVPRFYFPLLFYFKYNVQSN